MVNTKKSAARLALENMKMLQLSPKCVDAFRTDHSIWCSERLDLMMAGEKEPILTAATIYDTADPEYPYSREVQKALALVRDMDCFPYHVVQANTAIGNLFAVLYTTGEEEECPPESVNGKSYVYEVPAFVYNATQPNFSEFGFIWVKPKDGALVRVA